MSQPFIKIKNVSKIYQTKDTSVRALNAINLDIYKGEVLSLLGVNGAGKTTLSSILATLHPPTSGDVLYQDHSIYNNLIAYRTAMGFCPQRPNLDPFLNVEENLIFAGHYFLLDKKTIEQRKNHLIKLLGLQKYIHFKVDRLSGGYKQRLLIARALMHNPDLIILDEPTVGLDPDIRHQLWDIIIALKNEGKTVILTTHYLQEAEKLSDRVCILSKGKIIMIATLHDLKEKHKKETLEEIFLDLVHKEEDE
ncbi:MAG: ABC transporter ATP-binding protein [Candidatus Babeliales bacterium]